MSAIGSMGISATPLMIEPLMAAWGWRTVWQVQGVAIWLVVVPLGLLAMRDRPCDLGQRPDGPVRADQRHQAPYRPAGLTRAQALRHPYFWMISVAVALTGVLTTAVAFHQISLLTSRGLTTTEAAANFIPQTVAGLVGTLAVGYLMDRFAGRWLIVTSMLSLSLALVWGVVVGPGWSAIGFGAVLGASGAMIRAVEVAALPRYFGTMHIGSIRGVVIAISVAGTAVGPLLFASVFDAVGSHGPALTVSALAPVLVAGWAVVVTEPTVAVDNA